MASCPANSRMIFRQYPSDLSWKNLLRNPRKNYRVPRKVNSVCLALCSIDTLQRCEPVRLLRGSSRENRWKIHRGSSTGPIRLASNRDVCGLSISTKKASTLPRQSIAGLFQRLSKHSRANPQFCPARLDSAPELTHRGQFGMSVSTHSLTLQRANSFV